MPFVGRSVYVHLGVVMRGCYYSAYSARASRGQSGVTTVSNGHQAQDPTSPASHGLLARHLARGVG